MDIVRFDYEETVDRVKSKHKRKVSQLQALESELGLYFDEEEAERIAKQTMKEMNPNNSAVEQVSVEHIVAKARKEHKRKVSQFRAIKTDIGQYFPNEEEAAKLAAEVMKEFNPNDRSGKGNEVTVDSIVEKAMNEHKRRKSQFQAIENDLGLIFDKEDVNAITKDVMKKVFAQKHGNEQENNMNQLENAHVEEMQRRVDELDRKLREKNDIIYSMKQQIEQLEKSKRELAINSSKCLDQMRDYLKEYQNAIFAKKSDV
mmetsp:Transcript_3336/g.2839  ORF Transcript_3336/g.2839 Transcript_3336/m.2839 type:complete len:259 (-) Transcript_3336:53-829(-)